MSPLWTLEQAILVIRTIAPDCANAGWHLALAGSVLLQGSSTHDLDLIAYPHDSTTVHLDNLHRAFRTRGWRRRAPAAEVVKHWRTLGSTDCKHVEVWRTPDGRRVDIIIPSMSVTE